MTIEVIKNNKVVGSSKNLEIVTRYAREHARITNMVKRGHTLHVSYSDGAHLKADFGSEIVLANYIKRRGY